MKQTAQQVLDQSALYSDAVDYRMLKLPANAVTLAAGVVAEAALPFSALIVDKDEVTLMLPDGVCDEFCGRLRRAVDSGIVYRLITFDTVLEASLVGFIARISCALAAAEIPILTFAAFSRDHIFVPAEHFERALRELNRLKQPRD